MESKKIENEVIIQVYEYAANLLVKEKKSPLETKRILVEMGLDVKTVAFVVADIEVQIEKAKKERANKDMIYGALWGIGGIIATASDIGFIFGGAIVLE